MSLVGGWTPLTPIHTDERSSQQIRGSQLSSNALTVFHKNTNSLFKLYRDMFPHMFIVLLTHSDNSEIINLAWGQIFKQFSM